MIPWFVCRDDRGVWCVQRHGAWTCTITLTGASTTTDDRTEEHAHNVAAALNRIYLGDPFPGWRVSR